MKSSRSASVGRQAAARTDVLSVVRGEGPAAARRRLLETLAQSLYEGSDPSGVPWAKRALVVRDAWLLQAEEQLSAAGDQVH